MRSGSVLRARTLRRLRPPHQLRQLCDVDGDPPRLIAGEGGSPPRAGRVVLVLDVRERLSALGLHDEASAVILDGPGRQEAAG
jgi:hypothetical protein